MLRAEAGLTLDRLLRVTVPHGWFAPVVPGTKFVTLGGAVANDVHGKNHEHAGTFGAHVRALGLARSSGEVLTLSREENAELFAATIGGLGLTGVILWVELQLRAIRSAMIDTETFAIDDLAGFFRRAEESRGLALHGRVGRLPRQGQRDRARLLHPRPPCRHRRPRGARARRGSACRSMRPAACSTRYTIGLFNTLYRHRPFVLGAKQVHYDPFFFPLDAVAHWNRLYGPRGFFQHQSRGSAGAARSRPCASCWN